MFSILILCFVSVYVFAISGSPQQYGKRIVGGKPVSTSSWPMIVSIRHQNLQETLKSMNIPYSSNNGHFCAGSIISSNWVVTAASCFPDPQVQQLLDDGRFTIAKAYKLRLLMRTLVRRMNLNEYFICLTQDCSVWRSIDSIIIHPGYLISIGRNRPAYDLALIKLGQPVNEFISDILAPTNFINLSLTCKTAGWGVTNLENYNSAGEFREFEVKLIPPTFCQPLIKRLELCGVGISDGFQISDFCFFDTGGPLLCKDDSDYENWKLYGLISRDLKKECGDPEQRGIYTNLIGYYKWIKSVIG